MRSLAVLFASIFSAAALGGCGRGLQSPTSTTSAPPTSATSTVAPSLPESNWTADATVVAGSGGGCGWGTSVGETRRGVAWHVAIDGAAVVLDEDMSNWPTDDVPYAGTLSGNQFTASYSNGTDYLQYVCQFKGGTLTGTFSEDRASFEALETLTWGPPGGETTVQRRWVGTRSR